MPEPYAQEFRDDVVTVAPSRPDGVTLVSRRVLGLARAPYYRWLETPIVDSQLVEAYLKRDPRRADRGSRVRVSVPRG